MNKTKIEWCTYTWNPITGCLNDCEYCYARKIYARFKKSFYPTIHYERLGQPLRVNKPAKIFVCSVSDFWGKDVPQIWREEVYNIIKACPEHTFQILTKQPQNITVHDYDHCPDNVWIGISVTEGKYPHHDYQIMADWEDRIKFVSIEPLLGKVNLDIRKGWPKPDWIIIGGLSPKPIHPHEWIDDILKQADEHKIPIFIKRNAYYPKIRQEFPTEDRK